MQVDQLVEQLLCRALGLARTGNARHERLDHLVEALSRLRLGHLGHQHTKSNVWDRVKSRNVT